MSDDLVSRLKDALAKAGREWCYFPLINEAATALTEARAEIERLRAQLLITKRSRDYQKDRAVKARSAQNDIASGLDHWKARSAAAESELSTLRARAEKAESALAEAVEVMRPFANLAQRYDDTVGDGWIPWTEFIADHAWPSEAECQTARRFISSQEPAEQEK